MELVKLKMRKRYKISLLFIALLIIFLAVLGIMSFFFNGNFYDTSDIEVYGDLSIYFTDGKVIDIDENSKIKFSITNNGDKVNYFNIIFEKVRGEGSYTLTSDDLVVSTGELKSSDLISISDMSVDASVTKKYVLEINTDSNFKAVINLRKEKNKIKTFADSIISNSSVSNDSLTKVGSEAAIQDEGLIKTYDDLGVSYYFRGNVTNNYVNFADKLWRIVRINGDGTVRLVLDGTTDVLSSYYDSSSTDFSYKSSLMRTYLNNWLDSNLGEYKSSMAASKFCNDIVADENYNFNAYLRILTNKIPTLNCLGESFSDNIGLLSVDEAIYAGVAPEVNNTSYYLYNPNITNSWYTLTGVKGSEDSLNLFMINTDGSLSISVLGNLFRDIKPVINIIKNVEVTGDGTIGNPYKLVEK